MAAARSLGIGENLLRNWKQALQDQGDRAFPGNGKLPAVEEELRRREQAPADGARHFKKATGFFAKEAL